MNILDQFTRSHLKSSTFVDRAYKAINQLSHEQYWLRPKHDGAKEIVEEIMPLASFLKHFEIPECRVRCKHTGEKHGDADAHITLEGPYVRLGWSKPAYYIEVACAIHEKDHLQRIELGQTGFTWDGNKIRRDKISGKVISQPDIQDGHAVVESATRWAVEQIKAKQKKEYPRPCILLINLRPARPLTLSEWLEVITEILIAAPDSHPFAMIYITDWQTNFTAFLNKEKEPLKPIEPSV